MTEAKESQQKATSNKQEQKKEMWIEKEVARLTLLRNHPGLKAMHAIGPSCEAWGYALACKMVDGKDIFEDLLENIKSALYGLDAYLANMIMLANNIDSFKEYLKPEYEIEFLITGKIGGAVSQLESTALYVQEMLEQRDEQERKWTEEREKKQPHPIFANILDSIKGGKA